MAQGFTKTYPAQDAGKTVNRFVLSQGTTPGATTINVAVANQRHKIVGVILTMSDAGTIKFSGASDLTGAMNVAGQGGFVIPPNPANIYVQTGINEALTITTTVGGANGVILYLTE